MIVVVLVMKYNLYYHYLISIANFSGKEQYLIKIRYFRFFLFLSLVIRIIRKVGFIFMIVFVRVRLFFAKIMNFFMHIIWITLFLLILIVYFPSAIT